jgi:hypothetical protein
MPLTPQGMFLSTGLLNKGPLGTAVDWCGKIKKAAPVSTKKRLPET